MVVLSSILIILTSDAKSQLSAGFGRVMQKVVAFLTEAFLKKSRPIRLIICLIDRA